MNVGMMPTHIATDALVTHHTRSPSMYLMVGIDTKDGEGRVAFEYRGMATTVVMMMKRGRVESGGGQGRERGGPAGTC